MEWHRDFQNCYRITSPEVKVRWMICSWKYNKLGDHRIKGRKSPLEANSTLLRLFLRMPKSSLLIEHRPVHNSQLPCLASASVSISWKLPHPHHWRILSYVRVSGISKMAACNRKWIYTTNSPRTLTWKRIRNCPVMMLDAKNFFHSLYIVVLFFSHP